MKNKLSVEYPSSEKLELVEQRAAKNKSRPESVTPKIVVYPPMEDIPETPRGSRILKAIGRRLTRRSADADSLGSSSSSDSVSCETGRADGRSTYSASDSGSDESDRPRRHRSTVSLRKVFQNLSLSSRSQSCSPTERQRPPKKQSQPQRILRPPMTYTYARGMSGLPTQRVPRHAVCCASLSR